ncbi:MAG TPA: ATP-binding protein [Candidatus Saccharimonadales bacterium]|nr:ATP-binding protein [Candidatus Saccharimonadales bacterium]
MPKPQELLQPHVISYFKSSWYTRWLVIAAGAASFWFLPHINRGVVELLILLAIAYNLVLLAGYRYRWRAVIDQRLMLIIDGVLALVLIICSNGIASPYFLVLALVVVSGSYWYGARVAVAIAVVQAAALYAQLLQHDNAAARNTEVLAVRMVLMASIGLYVAWLTGSERSERSKLIALGTETEKERQQLLALINNMRDAVIVVDNDDKVVIHNQAAAALAGGGRNLQGKPISHSLHFVDASKRPLRLKIKPTDDESAEQDVRVKAPDGSLISVALNIAPYIVDRQNRGHVLILRDVSQDKTIDEEREEFIAVASHELRTPLTIAQNSISVLLSPPYLPDDKDSVEMLNSALRSLQQLSHIISDLTNLSRVKHEQLDVQLEPLNPIVLLQDFHSDYSGQAKAKGLDLKVKIDPKLNSATILTSRYVVGEILSIYVDNALKFTETGTVTLSVTNPKNESSGVTFSVSDTGIGISQSDQEKIFKKFFQSEEYATRLHGGTGLGLYIAQRLARRITAKLWFETKLGKGSTFYLWVPPYSRHKQDRSQVAAAETKDFFNTV